MYQLTTSINITHTKNLSQTNKLFVIQVRILQVLGQL